MIATVIEWKALLDTVLSALIAGVGVTLAFSLAILGASRFADLSRDNRPIAAAAFGVLTGVALAASAAAITIGIIVMTSK
jgi:hypothetical protein